MEQSDRVQVELRQTNVVTIPQGGITKNQAFPSPAPISRGGAFH